MIAVKTVNGSPFAGHRILVIALTVSLAWHILCLSAVKIVSNPASMSSVKFSKVAFLGPILSTVNMEVRAEPAGRTFLEMRFHELSDKGSLPETTAADLPDLQPDIRNTGYSGYKDISALVEAAVSGSRFEPDFQAE